MMRNNKHSDLNITGDWKWIKEHTYQDLTKLYENNGDISHLYKFFFIVMQNN